MNGFRALQVAFSTPKPGQESDYHRWYNTLHLPEYLDVPGIVSAQRFQLNDWQRPGALRPSHSHMSIYEIEGNFAEVFGEVERRWQDGRIGRTETVMPGSLVHLWVPITPRLQRQQREDSGRL